MKSFVLHYEHTKRLKDEKVLFSLQSKKRMLKMD